MNDVPKPGSEGFTEEERAAIKERAKELKTARRRGGGKEKAAADRQDVLNTIAGLPQPDRALAERVHDIITAEAPDLTPRLWYGMPAYARNGKVLCFFLSAHKDEARYSTLAFTGEANLDDGAMWPTTYALTELTPSMEAAIRALVRRAVS
ncbi:iron chaperone [Spongiactinospora sp. 9N601]|uniref:iron chaperone n=1 Tax=Spongiactinospora sp. 9N601 TaxID=3375149 RepID=UPI0037985073